MTTKEIGSDSTERSLRVIRKFMGTAPDFTVYHWNKHYQGHGEYKGTLILDLAAAKELKDALEVLLNERKS